MREVNLSGSELAAVYRDLHQHPELSNMETRTAAVVAERLTSWGYAVTSGVGGTGVVGVLESGSGPTVLLRADMDALPLQEKTGLDYASTDVGVDPRGEQVPVMHACGHDVHVTCLLGAAARLAAERAQFGGRVILVFQPAEELGVGARAMVADGLFERFGRPDVVLGQHVAPFPAGMLGLRAGPTMAATDAMTITMHGRGGHGSRPETTVDPVVLGAATVMRLQSIVARETAATDSVVVTIGSFSSGTKENIIADSATLGLSVRSFDEDVRQRTLNAITRIVTAEAAASGAPREPEFDFHTRLPSVVTDPDAVALVRNSFDRWLGPGRVIDPGLITGSEDVGELSTAASAPLVFWFLGGADPALFERAQSAEDVMRTVQGLPSNHSPLFAPIIEPTLSTGVEALVVAARVFLDPVS